MRLCSHHGANHKTFFSSSKMFGGQDQCNALNIHLILAWGKRRPQCFDDRPPNLWVTPQQRINTYGSALMHAKLCQCIYSTSMPMQSCCFWHGVEHDIWLHFLQNMVVHFINFMPMLMLCYRRCIIWLQVPSCLLWCSLKIGGYSLGWLRSNLMLYTILSHLHWYISSIGNAVWCQNLVAFNESKCCKSLKSAEMFIFCSVEMCWLAALYCPGSEVQLVDSWGRITWNHS